ncbi:uncharacterized protein DDB_G0271670 [Drosophila sechellia]|uniref:GM24011 n=1 Tax=Drosophila sechellia TaxID=7238 RepID=B4HHE9_DROSE|nr:uncharacterized protein DDB_G0271670 [Drosophila sechellia]EDW42488.1 GM24011 [Drosophila sechellia]
MFLPIATLLLIFTGAAFAADSFNQMEEFVDFEDIDEVPNAGSNGVTDVPIITATPISITTSSTTTGLASEPTADGLTPTLSTTEATTSTHSSTPATTTTDSSTPHSTTNDSTTDESTTTDFVTEPSTTAQASTRIIETTVSTTSSTTTASTTSPSTSDSTTNYSTTTETTAVPTTSSSTTDSSLISSSTSDSSSSDSTTNEISTSGSNKNLETSTTSSSTTDSITSSPNKSDFTTTESETESSTTTKSRSIATSTSSSPTTVSTTVGSTIDSTTSSVSTEDLTTTTTESTTTTEQPTEEETILALLAENAGALDLFNTQLDAVSAINWKIDAELDNQAEYLDAIEVIEKLLQNQTQEFLLWEVEPLRSIVTSIQKIDVFANRSIEVVSDLTRLQEQNQDRVRKLVDKLNATQGQILRSAKGLVDRLNFVNQLILGYIEPKVNSLKDSFANLNKSQVNSLIELKNVPEVRNQTKASIRNLSFLNNQLATFYQTQENRYYSLEAVIKAWTPTNLNAINDLTHALSISQKRTDLAIAISGSAEYKTKTYPNHFISYEGIKDNKQSRKTRAPQILGAEDKALESSWNIVAPA